MNWTNARLIFEREVRDQLRDRRTLFMIFVLPVMLYPLLGLSIFQISQFVRQHATSVLVLGASELPDSPKLMDNKQFVETLFATPRNARLLKLQSLTQPELEAELRGVDEPRASAKDPPRSTTPEDKSPSTLAQRAIRQGRYQVVVYFPPGFAAALAKHNHALPTAEKSKTERPQPLLFHNSASEKSQLAHMRVVDVLDRWRRAMAAENLKASGIDPGIVKPFDFKSEDVADAQHREAAAWSKVFPFLLLIWALTGAFYPAIDLCAGEKERGTLETLLTSPATRHEIVWGKLLTIVSFSLATVLLNVLSMGIVGYFILAQLPQFGAPPATALGWMLLAAVPVSAMFSALCLALAAFARSTKEGQYYLMPLVLITMPLVVIPMSPGVELSLGNSLIPVAGIVLLLRNLVEGNYLQAVPFIAPVVGVTLLCCLMSIRWAVDQFNTESVLFRESERLDLGLWLKHIRRDREDVPSVAQAALCAVLILMIRFFMSFALEMPRSFNEFAQLALVTQLVVVATPTLLMTIMLTRSPRKTLLLFAPPWWGIPAAALLAILLHPVASVLQKWIVELYPPNEELAGELAKIMQPGEHFWLTLLAIAIVPAICEELAFRGFVLSGLRRLGHKWRAIVLASVCFGLSHAIFQQSLIAALIGIVIGYLAVQSGSIVTTIVFHMLHNALLVLTMQITEPFYNSHPILEYLGSYNEQGIVYHWPVVALCGWMAFGLLYWIHRQPYKRTAEEALQEAIDHHAAQSLAG